MARKLRIFVKDVAQHIILKSLSDITLFKDVSDYQTFMQFFSELNINHAVDIHAYILKEDYFELLLTPHYEDSLSKFMQRLGRLYVAYYNKKYNRSGTLFEGRYKASLVEGEGYLFDVMKFIEQKESINFTFSSVRKNLFHEKDSVISFNKLYNQTNYEKVFNTQFDLKKYNFIEECLEKQAVTGTKSYIEKLEILVGTTLVSKNRGRPKKQTVKKGKKMYKKLVILDKEQHKSLKVSDLQDLNFAKKVSFIPVEVGEIALVGEDFPIVFSANDEPEVLSIVSLGEDSLAINSDGKWITPYVPVYLRKYPFSLASSKEGANTKIILIDEESSLCSKSKGKQLFKKNGENSDILNNAIDFLTAHDQKLQVTKQLSKIISQSGILEDREIAVGEGDEKQVLIKGFRVVNKEKLYALSDDTLALWVRKGIITIIDSHLKSLQNIEKLFNLIQQRQN